MSKYGFPCLCLMLFAAGPAFADGHAYELSLLGSYRISDSLTDDTSGASIDLDDTRAAGFIASMRRDAESFYDFYFSRQDTTLRSTASLNTRNVRMDYYQVGGTVMYEHDSLRPFATGGLGLTHISTSDPGLSSETHASLSVGGGIKVPLSKHAGLRLEARVLGTFYDTRGSILCSGGACTATIWGEMYLQLDTAAGLYINF